MSAASPCTAAPGCRVTTADAGRLAQALAGDLDAALPAVLDATRRLVEIDSGSDDADGVRAVSEAVAELLAPHGFALSWTPVAGRGPLLSAVLHPQAPRRVLVLGHADTVWPRGTAAAWPFRQDGDRICGPGVGDMKACLVMASAVLAALSQRGQLDGLGVSLLVVPDEEVGSVGSRAEIERAAAAADACLCLEAASPDGAVVVERGAVGAMLVRASGRSAHVTDDPPGASALLAAGGAGGRAGRSQRARTRGDRGSRRAACGNRPPGGAGRGAAAGRPAGAGRRHGGDRGSAGA